MKTLERILLTTDFGDSAEDAVTMAISVAKTFDSEVTLIHVVPEVEDSPVPQETLQQAMRALLDELRERLVSEGINVTASVVETGVPFQAVTRQADLDDANVIIVGSGNKKAREKFRLGITAERLIRWSHRPVWVVKKGAAAHIKSILCPVDLSETSRRALRSAAHLSRRLGAELNVVSVVPPLAESFLGLKRKVSPADQQAYAERKQQRFAEFLKDVDLHGVKWQRVLEQGAAHEVILRLAKETACDLIVMGSVGLTDDPQILLGRVAEKVAREMPCSLVMMRKIDPVRLRIEKEFANTDHMLQHGRQLLEGGFSDEAIKHFQQCVGADPTCVPAWEGLAVAQERLGRTGEAQKSRARAKEIRQEVWSKKVEGEVRAGHWMWRG